MGATLPRALEPLAALPRWVGWRIVGKPGEKPRKLPIDAATGKAASSADPATWALYAEAAAAVPRRRLRGVGITLGDLGDGRWLIGLDLDLCRSPVTGEIMSWAREKIARWNTYAEVSPSGTGVKLFGYITRPIEVPAKEITVDAPIPEGAEGADHDEPEIGLYPGGRYFTVTGQALDGCPDHLADVTEAAEALAAEMAVAAKPPPERPTRKRRAETEQESPDPAVGEERPALDPEALAAILAGLPRELAELIDADPKLAESWLAGAKLTKGGNTSKNGLEFSLVHYLASRDQPDELIELAVRHYPHGQVGSGKLTGGNADRRIDRLLKEAARIREKARKWRESEAWYHELLTNKEEEPRDCLANGAIILRRDPAFRDRIRFDQHRGTVICRDMPWRPGGDWREWENVDDLRLADWCQLRGVPLRPTTCADAVAIVADEHRFHPIRAWLDGLKHDGVPRLDAWLGTYLGVRAGNAAYVRAVGRAWLISAVARVYEPGCKADHALILEGRQGAGKSSALAALVPDPAWFADEISDLGSKDSAQDLRGKWILELAELSALKRGEIERVKAFMTRAKDHYRPSYGRRSQDFPRQCVFAGTTNADAYLGDETGNRRFWPVRVGTIDLDGLRRDRDQLWAEAMAAYKAGERWWLDGETEAAAAGEQAERRIEDPWEQTVLALAEAQTAPVIIPGILNLMDVPKERQDQLALNRVARILRANGWERYRHHAGGARLWAYRRAPVAPVPERHTGAQIPGDSGQSPARPGRPSTSHAHRGPTPHPGAGGIQAGGGGGPDENFAETTGATGASAPRFVPTWAWREVPDGAVLPPGLEIRMDMETGRSWARMPDPGPKPIPEWTDSRAWFARLHEARTSTHRIETILAWGRAAGCTVGAANETLSLTLPKGLACCPARFALCKQAKDAGIAVRQEAAP